MNMSSQRMVEVHRIRRRTYLYYLYDRMHMPNRLTAEVHRIQRRTCLYYLLYRMGSSIRLALQELQPAPVAAAAVPLRITPEDSFRQPGLPYPFP